MLNSPPKTLLNIVLLCLACLVYNCSERDQNSQGTTEPPSSARAHETTPVPEKPDDSRYFGNSELLDSARLSNYMPSELSLMRNTIYARHGHTFRSEDLEQHFSLMHWYKPREGDVSKDFDEMERENVRAILKAEKLWKDEKYSHARTGRILRQRFRNLKSKENAASAENWDVSKLFQNSLNAFEGLFARIPATHSGNETYNLDGFAGKNCLGYGCYATELLWESDQWFSGIVNLGVTPCGVGAAGPPSYDYACSFNMNGKLIDFMKVESIDDVYADFVLKCQVEEEFFTVIEERVDILNPEEDEHNYKFRYTPIRTRKYKFDSEGKIREIK